MSALGETRSRRSRATSRIIDAPHVAQAFAPPAQPGPRLAVRGVIAGQADRRRRTQAPRRARLDRGRGGRAGRAHDGRRRRAPRRGALRARRRRRYLGRAGRRACGLHAAAVAAGRGPPRAPRRHRSAARARAARARRCRRRRARLRGPERGPADPFPRRRRPRRGEPDREMPLRRPHPARRRDGARGRLPPHLACAGVRAARLGAQPTARTRPS
jgi:hypothetical protein